MFWEGVMSDLSAIKLNGTTYTLSDDYARDSMAKIESGTLATKAYAVGDFLINNNHLYKVTSAIAIGVKFVVGTNIELVKLSDEVKLKAPLTSPTFTGTPKVPTASTGTKTTQIASTAYVQNEIDIVNNNVQSTIDYVQNELGGVLTSLRGDLNSLDSEVDTISDDVDSLDSAVNILTRQGTTLRDDGIVVCNAVDGGDNVFFMIDDTLTEAHKAADAKATGDAISSLNEDITNSLDSVDAEIGELNDRLEDVEGGAPYAPAIIAESSEDTSHDVLEPLKITFIGNNYAFRTAKFANRKNLLPKANNKTGLVGDVTYVANDYFAIMKYFNIFHPLIN